MKHPILLLSLVLAMTTSSAQRNITGTWEGNITPQIRLIFHFDKKGDGTLWGSLDSPDQGVKGLSLSSLRFQGDSLFVEIEVAHAKYQGLLSSDTSISGVWLQNAAKIGLNFHRTSQMSALKILNRPQTPKPPFPYQTQDVEYDNADKTVHYGATLTYPREGKGFTCAILITGSGLQDRDETIFDHKPFAVIADYLTRKGFAVLRVDDRTMGKSTGEVTKATSLDFSKDVLASLAYLKTRVEIDPSRIGLIGHSEGGMIAPMVYAQYPHLKFIISLAGTGISGAAILLRQQTDPLKPMGLGESAFHAFYELTQKTLFIIHDHSLEPDSSIQARIRTLYVQWKSDQPDSILTKLNVKNVTAEGYSKQTAVELRPWFKYFIATEPSQYWQKVKCPVLALDGSKDIQVYPDENIEAITAALRKAGNKNFTTHIFPGLNHLFQHCVKCTVPEYADLEETFAPEVLDFMADWLQKNAR